MTITNLLLEIWALLCEMAPYLLLGFLLAGLMHEYIPHRIYSEYLSRPNFRSVFLAALFGVPLPLCSCGVLPTAMGLRREGGSRGATVAFLISTPQTGVDSIIATYSLMGLPFAILRPIVAFLTALMGGTLVNQMEGDKEQGAGEKEQGARSKSASKRKQCDACISNAEREQTRPKVKGQEVCIRQDDKQAANVSSCSLHLAPCSFSPAPSSLLKALRYAFVEMVGDIGKWLVVGLVIAGLITTLVPDQWFSAFQDNSLLSILLVLCISVPMYVCATGSIPIAVALMMKGLTPGAALVLLMAGPACNVASLLVIRKVLGRRTQLIYLAAIVLGAVAFGLGIDYLLPREWFTSSLIMQSGCCHEHISTFGAVCAAVLFGLLVNAWWHRHSHHHAHGCDCCDDGCDCCDEEEADEATLYHIQGMHCSHCATNVERAIRSLDGVTDVDVDLSAGTARVRGKADPEAVRQAVEDIGYTVGE